MNFFHQGNKMKENENNHSNHRLKTQEFHVPNKGQLKTGLKTHGKRLICMTGLIRRS